MIRSVCATLVCTARYARDSLHSPMSAQAAAPLRAWLDLTKIRLNALVVFAVAASFYFASVGPIDWKALIWTAIGAALVAMGSSGLNMVMERPFDRLMERTKDRPLPSGQLSARGAAIFGAALSAAGLLVLGVFVNLLSAAVALVIAGSYLLVYTPLKRRTTLNTIVGAVPGALPAVLGWTGARNSLDGGAAILFSIVFLWQIPHFLAISRLHSDDYSRGGFKMLSSEDAPGFSMGRQAVIWSVALVPVSLMPAVTGLAGRTAFWLALILGGGFVGFAIDFAVERGTTSARRLFVATLAYLPALFAALVIWKARPAS
jgi:protoheme IX farnesyltransferase